MSGGDQRVGLILDAGLDPSGVLNGIKAMQNGFNSLRIDPKLMSGLTKEFEKVNTLITKYQSQLAKGVNTKADAKNLAKTGSEIQASLDNIVKGIREVNSTSVSLKVEDATKLKSLEDNLKNIKKQIQDTFQQKIDTSGLSGALSKFAAGTGRAKSVQNLVNKAEVALERQELEKFGNTLDEIKGKLNGYKGTTLVSIGKALGLNDLSSTDVQGSITKITNRIDELKGKATEAGKAIQDLKGQETEAAKAIDSFKPGAIERGKQATDDLLNSAEKLPAAFSKTKDAADNAASGILSAKTQVEQLQQSTQYFFSLRNMINLLKRGIDEAVQSVKELDKAMTETAVVTDYKVSDLWGMLPEYTKVANQLGATTQGAYETMTLYYQQGLDQQQAFELGAETMKMARIAGLDYAETTDMMTAALRGFNMELNETSAKRVNDVYSELAAITASDTEELGTAMQRTASIAASAGASFEGTTAFLAQAIETTREPAENIGTAMKTIVARFQEMKKNPLEISEVDGEEVDYNKIDAALKTIGVDLKDTNGQFREFDQVMLDISAKWDTLSQSQQRYIATTAAGSRQQSRFIAMVSNYDRTMQLMEAANNSAGASDEQFGKTMDSLESKLNQLHNAWQQFTMGIANNGMIKMAVDGLTGFLNITNKIIDVLSLGSGALKSFLSVFAAFTGLKIAGRGANALIGGLGGLVDPKSSIKEGLKIGLVGQGKNAAQAKAITTPIVGSLSKISGQIAAIAKRQGIKDAGQKGSTAGVKQTSKEDYANTKRLFSQLSGKEGFKMGDAASLFGKLDAKHQLSMFNNSPGTKAAMKKASMAWFNSKGLSKELTKEGQLYINSIYKGMKEGQIPVDKGVELIGQPQKWGKYFGTETALAYSKSFIQESKPAMEASRQTAHEAAIASLGFNPEDYKVGSKELKGLLNDKNNEQIKKEYAALYSGFREDLDSFEGHGGAKGKVSDLGRLANDIGAVGDKFTQAGYGITTFGNALSQLGGPIGAIGSGIAAFGGAVSSMGMMVSGATSLITVFSEGIQIAGTSIAISGGAIAAVVGPLAAAAAAFLLVRAHLKKVKEAGEEVTNTFKETSKSAEDNVAKLKSYQSEFAQLSKGVDSNGYNVSLDDSQYQRYLEIVDDIAVINPDIVEGYNAQGHAIINNNKALEETLKKQQQIKDEAYDTYTNEESLQKLINARNINNDFKAINIKGESPSVYDGSGHGSEGRQKPVGLGRDVFNIVDQLRLNKDFDESSLQKYGIDSLNSLINGEEQAVKNFIKHRKQIEADLSNSGLELNDSILKGFEKLGEDSAAFDEAIKPVYDNLLASVSNLKVFESIAPEFREALNMGLKDLASQDLSAGEMSKAANNMAAKFANLTTGSGKYKDALEIVEQAQSNFANTLNETEYRADVEPAIQDLIKLKEEALDEGTAYGDALAEYLENQIQRISNFTSEGGANLTEALNTATDEIAAAEGALDSFNEATKKDFSTAAEGMKGIFDKTTETFKDSYGTEIQKHAEGMGDATFWTGAEALLSGKEIERLTSGKNGYDAAEAVAKKIKDLEPMLREGQEGFDAFTDRVLANADAMDKLAEAGVTYDKESGLITNIPDDQWHNVAEALGISDDLLTSMLNKGRQFADISFMNVEDARKALATSDYTIKGTQAAPGEQQNLYVKEDTLRRELADAGYVRREQQDEQIAKLLNEGVKTIPADATQLSSKELDSMAKDWGVNTLPDLIQTLNETGDFTKDEIKNYADQMGLLSSEAQYDELYSDIIEAAENPELVKQTGVLETISAQVAALADTRTGKEAKEDYDEAHKELVGGKGIDTQAQAFAKGQKLDENGKLVNLSAGEYEQTKASMQEVANSFRETAAIAAEKVKVTSGAERDYWKQVQKGAEADAARTDKYIQMADEAMKKRADAEKQEAEGRQKEVDARNEARKAEQDAVEAAAKEANKNAQEKGKTQTGYEQNKPVTESEGRAARDEGRVKEAQRQRQKELEEANKQRWEAENRRAQAMAAAEKKAAEDKLKTQKALQEQGEIEGQKLKQKYEAEEQARKRQNIEEQSRLEGEKLAERARLEQEAQRQTQLASQDQGRSQGRALSSEQTAVQAADIQEKTDYLLRTSINTSLKTALDNLDPTQIASDPAQSQAFSNLYADLINNRLPKPEDLQTLGIFNQLDSQYQNQIEEKSNLLGEKLSDAYNAFAEADKTALAMDIASDDKIGKAITSIGERLKSWRDKINNINTESSTNAPQVTSSINSGVSAVSQIAQNALKDTQSKITVDTSDGEAKITNLKTLVDSTVSTINQGATFTIRVPGAEKLKDAADAASNLSKQSGNQTVGVKTSFDSSAVKTGVNSINGMSAKVKVGADTSKALATAESARKAIDSKSATINVSTSVTGQNVHIYVTKHVKEVPGAYKGLNNKINYGHIPTIGSAAKGGKKGRIGPNNQGGMTLTGELGYEIAWLPSENRSMILGAKGPQMVNLPSDAVVWTHEQSKKILKQKSIPAGSHANETASSYRKKYSSDTFIGGNNNSKSNSNNSSASTSKKVEKAAKTVEDSAKDAADTIQKAYVWWENIARKTEASQRQQDKNQKEFEKYLKQVGANFIAAGKPVSEGGGGGDDLLANMNKTLSYYEAQIKKGTEEKSQLVTGTKEQTAANNIWWRGDHERGYTESQKANKAAYENNILSGAKISYKNGKDSIDEFVNLSGYIRQGADGSLEVVQEWIDGISNLEKRKAVADAANKAADDITSKINKAEDGIEKTKEAIEKMGETLYDTFFKWENELTKIWQIAQKIEQAEGRISRLKSYENLLNLQIETGIKQVVDEQGNLTDVSGEMINIFSAGVKELEGEIHLENQNIDEQRAHLEDLVNMSSKMEALEDIQDRLVNSALRPEDQKGKAKGSSGLIDSLVGGLSQEKLDDTSELALLKAAEGLEKDIELQTRAWDFMSATQNADGTLNIDFDSEAFEATKYATGMTSEDAEAIQKYVKDIVETNNNLSSAYDSLTSKMVDMNDKLKTLQDQWVGYAEELWKISEEEQKQEIDNLKKLSDSLTNSLKKLLDEVKRKIDQRRKQEDNAKTELDISKKQQRLASLRADTSGGNQVEIAKLQQEIADAQQNYQRSLEDQLLENLQQQGDLAAQQREQQIALQEATITAVNNAALVNKWMDDPLKYREEIFQAYKTANDFDKKPQALQRKLIQDFNKMFGGMITNQPQQETVENGLAATASELKVINDSINSIVNKSKENKPTKVTSTGAKSNTKVGDTKKKTDTAKAQAAASKKESEPAKQSTSKKQAAPSKPQVSKISRDLREGMRGDDVKILQTALKQLGCTGRGYRPLTIDGYFGPDTASAVREFQRNYKYKASRTLASDGVVGRYSKEAFKALGFKTGGLADYTGPAWLDGTPSKPELVLNATDTQNFLALRDILSKAIGSTNAINNSYGGNATYEININVDKLTSDYDVDRVAERVKKIIVKDSGYRNVTQVRNFK